MIRNRSRLAQLNNLAAHDYSGTIDHNQFPLSDSTDGGSSMTVSGIGNTFMSPTLVTQYVFLGACPLL
jgi:hypothetical protein